ncbi:MAG TPA: ComEC/Rec2 family competence protein, partial [Ilumatobacteraceae bacterium]
MRRAYRTGRVRWWQALTDGQVAAIVATVVIGIWLRRPLPVAACALIAAYVLRHAMAAVMCLVLGVAGVLLSAAHWRDVVPRHIGPYAGTACLVGDPQPIDGAVTAVFELDHERFEVWTGGAIGQRLDDHLSGECVWISGTRRALHGTSAHRAALRHVVGGLDIEAYGDWSQGSTIDRASNRVRRTFAAGSAQLRAPDDALFAGLVIGDDRNEPAAMVDQFRASGLSHLTAVSGQNVAFVLAAAAPLLKRLRSWLRWAGTLAVIAWFAALTRFEPSVLRASVMAAIAATGFVLGREKPPARVLLLAVGGLVLIDPFLVWSVGFWLSVGATAGVALLATPLAGYVPGPRWLAEPAAVSLAAQAGIAPISLLVFGTMPIVAVPANLLAVPVAGFVMLYG